jgi:hypothetical protein
MIRALESWVAETRRRRGEHVQGEPFSPGLVDPATIDPAAVRRRVAANIVALVGNRPTCVTFDEGDSCASLDQGVVNIDATFIDPPASRCDLVDELLVGVAAHEGGHLLLSRGLRKRPTRLRQWLYNLVEDERIEAEVARRWPPLSPPLSTTREELIRSDTRSHRFLGALFFLVRAPDRMPLLAWIVHERRLRMVTRILTPFPATPAEVEAAVSKLERIVPTAERSNLPRFPSLTLRRRGRTRLAGAPREISGPVRRGRRTRKAEWRDHEPPVVWKTAPPDPAGYASLRATVMPEARALRAAVLAATTVRRRTALQHGVLDRRRLHAWAFDDRLFRTAQQAARDITLVLILDLSGSMRSRWRDLTRVAVTFSESVRGLPHVRLYVYGHAADGDGFPCTEITRFATPACGQVLSLGSLPSGANNRDGHALELIARDCSARDGAQRRTRLAVHVCDCDPHASSYAGLPARQATRRGVVTFQRVLGPLVVLGMDVPAACDPAPAKMVPWHEACFATDLGHVLAGILAAHRRPG